LFAAFFGAKITTPGPNGLHRNILLSSEERFKNNAVTAFYSAATCHDENSNTYIFQM
jgi:hypothetical protein